MYSKLKIFTGNANRKLALEVSKYTGVPLGDANVFKFSNDNTFVKINENVRGADTFIIQPTCFPVNDNLKFQADKKGINITRVPIDLGVSEYAVKEVLNPLDLAFGGGEEFELVFSIDPSREEKLVEVAQKFGLTVHKIGYFSGDEKELIISDERFLDFELSHKGFEHFSK